jgi:Flp pilus assembly protein TadD
VAGTTTKAKSATPVTAADWHRQANDLVDEGKLDRAISAFRRALRLDDSLAEVHNDLGAAYFQKGWYAEAEECFRKAIERNPKHAVAHANLGAALRGLGRLNESRRAYQRALWLKVRSWLPTRRRQSAPAGIAPAEGTTVDVTPIRHALDAHQPARAVELAEALLRKHPESPDLLHVGALSLEAARGYDKALALVRGAIERRADRSEFRVTLARLLLRAGDLDGALQAAMTALKLEPGSALVHATISGIFHPWRDDLAEQAARHAIELDPELPLGHSSLAAVLWGQSRLEEAERAMREALQRAPKDVGFRASLALVLKDLNRMDEARALYRELSADAPGHGKVCMHVGTLAMESEGDLDTARVMYRKAQQSTDEPLAYVAEAQVDLLQGRFAAAWPNYEQRKQLSDQRVQHDRFAAIPDWDGKPLGGGRLLVYGEQGLGDEVMFASMFREARERAGGLVVLCDARLEKLFARSFPGVEVRGEQRPAQGVPELSGVAAKIAAGSLGALFRREARDFPEHRGYLTTDPRKVQAWRERLGPSDARLSAGLSWRGGVQKTGRSRRSLSPAELQPLLALPGVRWVSLQHGDDGELEQLLRFPEATGDIDDLASLIDALDIVVSVCNTNVHVAGALGREVLVMTPFVPEWRYGMSGERMAWYPSARMFRQERYRAWDSVVAEVAAALSRRAARPDG